MSAISQGLLRIIVIAAALVSVTLGTAILAPPSVARAADTLPVQSCNRSHFAWTDTNTAGCADFGQDDIKWKVK